MTEDDGFGHLGILCGHDVIGPRQFVAARNEWIKPRHEAFQPRNGWSLYNAVTEVLKSSPPQEVMERHVELHDYFSSSAAGITNAGIQVGNWRCGTIRLRLYKET